MFAWLARNGINLFTLITLAFFGGVAYSKMEDTAAKQLRMEVTQHAHTVALIEIVTELRIKREIEAQRERAAP